MYKTFFTAILLASTFVSTSAYANRSCEDRGSNRVIGTVGGAAAGGVLGNVIAGRGDKTEATIIGGVIGAVIGNQVTKSNRDCAHAYGYYDENNRWHATGNSRTSSNGYFDRNGEWQDGAPNGYYDNNNRWIASNGDRESSGYYETNGHWVPSNSNGYYDRNDRWVAAEVRSDSPTNYISYMPRESRARADWLSSYIQSSRSNGTLRRGEAKRANAELASIRRQDTQLRSRRGNLSARNETAINIRLDRLTNILRVPRNLIG